MRCEETKSRCESQNNDDVDNNNNNHNHKNEEFINDFSSSVWERIAHAISQLKIEAICSGFSYFG